MELRSKTRSLPQNCRASPAPTGPEVFPSALRLWGELIQHVDETFSGDLPAEGNFQVSHRNSIK